jgi:phage recombination protein Bet
MDEKGLVKINTDSGELTLSPSIVRKYLVNGNGAVSDGEVAMFLALCKFQKLNPFLRDAYLIKYGTQPASIITGKEAFLKRAMRAKDCRGFKAGVIWYSTDNQGSIGYTDGVLPPGTKLAGGWAEIYREGWAFPLRVEVSLQEYIAKKNDGTPNKMWQEKPATMIRKIALVQALREAFPEDLAGMYSPEELDTNGDLPHTPVPMADYVDVGKPDVAAQPSSQDQAAADESQQTGRRRRTKFQVDAQQFGVSELSTCGATPEQLLALRDILRGNTKEASDMVKAFLKSIGHQELSFLRENEAKDLLLAIAAQTIPQSTEDSNGAKIQCPYESEPVYESFCRSHCERRATDDHWCATYDGPPPEGEELI